MQKPKIMYKTRNPNKNMWYQTTLMHSFIGAYISNYDSNCFKYLNKRQFAHKNRFGTNRDWDWGFTGRCCRSGSVCWCRPGWLSSCPPSHPADELCPPTSAGSPRSFSPALWEAGIITACEHVYCECKVGQFTMEASLRWPFKEV